MVKQQHQYAGRRTKKFAAMSAIASVVLSLAGAFVATPALAADLPAGSTLPSGLTTLFQIDGDMAGPNDWDTVSAGTYGPYLTPNQGYRSTGILGVTGGSEYCVGGTNPGTDNTIFRPSTKIDTNPWPTTSGAPNKKSDICDAGAAFEIVDVNGQQHIIMYQYWTRSPDGTGDLTVYQELKGGAAGRDGDYLLEFNYNSSGSGGINIRSLRWNGSSWVAGAAVYDAD